MHLLQALPALRNAQGGSYSGVQAASGSVLSHIKGTSLSFWGMEIDITNFAPTEANEAERYASYDTFIDSLGSTLPEPPLPPTLDDYNAIAMAYLNGLNPYTPMLDKRDMMALIERRYTDITFEPSAAESTILHMLLAHFYYQHSVRSDNDSLPMLQESNNHYRYSLTLVRRLWASHKLQDVQAMTLLSIHMRNFPRPGAAWIMTDISVAMAFENGMQRSAVAWGVDQKPSDHECEMRKRVFWTLFGLHVGLSGKLGRPMRARLEDIDIEFPEPVPDQLDGESLVDDFFACSFHVGIHVCKILALTNKMYSTIYAVRRSIPNHENDVRAMDRDLDTWRRELPQTLVNPDKAGIKNRVYHVFAFYLKYWEAEFQLLLHHPAMCPSSASAQFKQWNSDNCLNATSKMLEAVRGIKEHKSLDHPWINVTVYISAIFIMLFVHYQRPKITSIETEKLSEDVKRWLEIIEEVGRLLGMCPQSSHTFPMCTMLTRTRYWREAEERCLSAHRKRSCQHKKPTVCSNCCCC